MEPQQECHTKILSGSVTIKRTASDCKTALLSRTVKTKLLPVSITIKSTDRECRYLDTSRKCHKRNYNNGVQHSRECKN